MQIDVEAEIERTRQLLEESRKTIEHLRMLCRELEELRLYNYRRNNYPENIQVNWLKDE